MYNWLMTVASVVIGILGFYHALIYFKEKDFAINFFVAGFVFGILRENLVQMISHLYEYPGYTLYIFKAPLLLGFGWSVAFYIGLFLAKDIISPFSERYSKNIIVLALCAAVIAGLLGFAIEVTAVQVEWWIWYVKPFYLGMPLIVPFGWAGGAFIFLVIFLYIQNLEITPTRKLIYILCLVPVMIFLHLGYVFLVKAVLQLLGFV